MYQEKAGTN